jgi:hypothetical protein
MVIVLNIYKEAAVMLVLMKVFNIRCHVRGHINFTLVLQSCADSMHDLPVSSSEMFPASSDGACNLRNTKVEVDVGDEDVIVTEEGREETAIHIKQEEIREDIIFPDMKTEPDEVSYLCVCLLFDTFFCVQKCQFFCNISISGQLKQLHSWE